MSSGSFRQDSIRGYQCLQVSHALKLLEKAADSFDRVGSPGAELAGDLARLRVCYQRLVSQEKEKLPAEKQAELTVEGGIVLSSAVWEKVAAAMSRVKHIVSHPCHQVPVRRCDKDLMEALRLIREAGVGVEGLT